MTAPVTDEALIERFKRERRESDYTHLYNKYYNELLRFVKWLSGNSATSDDIVQNTFTKVYEKPDLYQPGNNFKVWLFVIAKNLHKNEIRDKVIRARHQLESDSIIFQQKNDAIDDRARLTNVRRAVTKLSKKHREVFVLKYSNNLTIKEISQVCDCSEGTVKSRLFYAIKQIKEWVQN